MFRGETSSDAPVDIEGRMQVLQPPKPMAAPSRSADTEPMHMPLSRLASALLTLLLLAMPPAATGANWAQFMRNSQHTGDAPDEQLAMPLRLVAQIRLDDAVLTSPAVVGGRAYVVDQMGSAYCVDPDAGRIVWKSAPEGAAAYGSNTSSPCVVQGRVFYATTAANVHILDARTGNLIRSIPVGWPVVSAITTANDSIYFQSLGAVVHCLDLNGNERWQWDHYGLASKKQPSARPPDGHGRTSPHYGGNPVAVSGTKVVTAIGYDLICLNDRTTKAELAWQYRSSLTAYVPKGTAIADGYVYYGRPGSDGMGMVRRNRLDDGSYKADRDEVRDQWAVLGTPAVRGATAYFARQVYGVTAREFGLGDGEGHLWSSFSRELGSLTPSLASPALSKQHCLFTTLTGELIAIDLAARGRGLDALGVEPFRFKTPHGKVISSSPAIADGRVYFGCDDGYLYVLGGGPGIEPTKKKLTLHRPKSRVVPAGKRAYAWPSAFGGPRNACFVEDPGFTPPFKLRWAARSGGLFKHPVCASDEDLVYTTLAGLVVCREQQTGRIRWRRKLPKQGWTRCGVLYADGKVYVPRMFTPRYPKVVGQANALYCLDGDTGDTLWERPIGIGDRLRASPVFVDGVVAFGSLHQASEGKRAIIQPHATWQYLAGSDPPPNWTSPEFDARGWESGAAGFGYGDEDDRTELDMDGKYRRVYLRRTFRATGLAGARELGLMVSYDDAFIAYLNGREVVRVGVSEGRGEKASRIRMHEAQGFEYFPIPGWRSLLRRADNLIALEGHNANLTSSDFSLDPYLVVPTADAPVGPTVDAWDAATGRSLWQVALSTRGSVLNGPAGCAGDGIMFFTGGGEGRDGAGETVAIRPRTGEVLWRTDRAYASRTGTPAYQDGRVYLPGVYRLPMTCLSADDGRIIWQHDYDQGESGSYFVHALSLGPDYFTVNNKYEGGAKRWTLSDGTMSGTPDTRIELFGGAHGCGSVVLTSTGLALSATINGLYAIDVSTGNVLWNSLGLAPRTCPHPIVANGRIFYAPQVNGMLYCFEPENAD